MSVYLEIVRVHAREILDSRGNPTVETEVTVKNSQDKRLYTGHAAVPSGASTGIYEAVELRDGGARYRGLGVKRAVDNVNTILAPALIGMNSIKQAEIDAKMLSLDATGNKASLGANALLSVSLACAQASAESLQLPLYEHIGGISAATMPVPMMNILNGGAHSKNNLDFQEFMIMPVGACCFREALRMGTEVYHSLKQVLQEKGLSTAVGDEGGFAPDVDGEEEVLELLMEAVNRAGYEPGSDICFALDVAASEWKPVLESQISQGETATTGTFQYHLPKSNRDYCSDELIDLYKNMIQKYPIVSIEDPLDEEDWAGWRKITKELGESVQLVGDDLFVTNTERLKKGIEERCANSILIKVNQIGTLTETIAAIRMARKAGYTAISSHRSGETEDTVIADLAVAMNTGLIKTGAPCRSERVAKYNRLLKIEEELGVGALYAGRGALTHIIK